MTPLKGWPGDLRHFAKVRERWKRQNRLLDFTDLLLKVLEERIPFPFDRVRSLHVDEVHDNSPLEMAVLRHWASGMGELSLYADPAQSIYGWKGATPAVFLQPPLPDEYYQYLRTSHRLPKSVHALAERLLRGLPEARGRRYSPRDAPGFVGRTRFTRRDGDAWLTEIEQTLEGAGGTAMAVASCSDMLNGLTATCWNAGVPFHNPWRPTNGRWNPLGGELRDILDAFLHLAIDYPNRSFPRRLWTSAELAMWLQVVRADESGFPKAGRGKARRLTEDKTLKDVPLSPRDLTEILGVGNALEITRVADHGVLMMLRWLVARLRPRNSRLAYALRVVERGGPQALYDTPRIVIGTVHSLKGTQATHVWVAPDVSREADRSGHHRELQRLFYVGVTRARESVRVLEPMNFRHFNFGRVG